MKYVLSKLKKNGMKILLIFSFITIYILIYVAFHKYNISKDEIRKLIEPFGFYSIVALFIIQILFSLTPLPDGAMPLVAIILYGPIGVPVIMLGMFVAAIIHYRVGQILGENYIIKHFPGTEKYLKSLGNNHLILRLVALRMFTLVSFDITSYIAGISNINLKTFLIATAIGLIPTNLILILMGYGLFAENGSDILIIWGLVLIVFIFLFFFYKKNKLKVIQ